MNIDKKNIKYYSQHGEDSLLWDYFGYKDKGFFIEVGAFDGKYLSNSYSFEKQGWTGLCVEPHPDFFTLCKNNRSGSVCANIACVGNDQGEVVLKVDPAGLYSGLADDPEHSEYVRQIFENKQLQFEDFQDVPVKAARLDALLEQYFPSIQSIDFVSIDVEGTEIDVLEGFDLNRYAPEVVIVEANSDESKQDITLYLEGRGYFFARMTGVNLIFVNSEEACCKMQDIIIRCDIEKQEHPVSSEYSVKSIADGLRIDDFASLKLKAGRWRKEVTKLRKEVNKLRKEEKRLSDEKRKMVIEKNQLNNSLEKVTSRCNALMANPFIRFIVRVMRVWETMLTHR